MEVKKADVRTQGGGGVCRNSFRQSAARFPAECRVISGRDPSECRQKKSTSTIPQKQAPAAVRLPADLCQRCSARQASEHKSQGSSLSTTGPNQDDKYYSKPFYTQYT